MRQLASNGEHIWNKTFDKSEMYFEGPKNALGFKAWT